MSTASAPEDRWQAGGRRLLVLLVAVVSLAGFAPLDLAARDAAGPRTVQGSTSAGRPAPTRPDARPATAPEVVLVGAASPAGGGAGPALAPARGPHVAPHLTARPQARPPTVRAGRVGPGALGSRAPPTAAGT